MSAAASASMAVMMVFGLATSAAARTFFAHAAYVGDGDSLWVRESDGRRTAVRLHGIDAPEICQEGGQAARDALRGMIGATPLRVTSIAVDRYGRMLATVQLAPQGRPADALAEPEPADAAHSINAAMVRAGHAWNLSGWPYRRSPGWYADEEREAQRLGLGVHALGDAQSPAEFRRAHGRCFSPSRASH